MGVAFQYSISGGEGLIAGRDCMPVMCIPFRWREQSIHLLCVVARVEHRFSIELELIVKRAFIPRLTATSRRNGRQISGSS